MGCCESTERNGSTKTKEKKDKVIEIAKVVGTVAGVAVLAWGIFSILGSTNNNERRRRRMMKAPGRNNYIYRDDFESDPAAYFHGLRHN